MQWIQRFPSFRCLSPPESCMWYWEKIGNKKSEQRKTEQMQTIKYEHVFPLLKTCDFSPLEHQASVVSYTLPLSILSPPIEMIKLWCDLSLPLWHQFPRRALLDFCYKWVWSLSHRAKQHVECDAGRGQESLSGAGAKRIQEQVASCLSCSEIDGTELCASVAPKGFGVTEFITEKTLVTSTH